MIMKLNRVFCLQAGFHHFIKTELIYNEKFLSRK